MHRALTTRLVRRTIGRPVSLDAVAAARTVLAARRRRARRKTTPINSHVPDSRSEQLDGRESAIEQQRLEVCEIGCWRGYVKWQFYVRSQSPLAGSLSSPYFRGGRGKAPERTEASLRAHVALVEKLAAMGWEQDGRGDGWYAERFQRERR